MPGRSYTGNGYRFGFNGKEKDDEATGNGNQYDYGFRIYNPRLGKFLSVDPLTTDYPELTPYQFAGNTAIQAIDLDGLEPFVQKPCNCEGGGGGGVRWSLRSTPTESQKPPLSRTANTSRTSFSEVKSSTSGANTPGQVKSGVTNTQQPQVILTKAEQIKVNQQKGAEFQKQVKAEKSLTQTDVAEEITIKGNKTGVKVRVDIVGKDQTTNQTKLTEVKSSETAKFTPNQVKGYPEIEKYGGEVVGKGKPPYVGGTQIPPTKVEVVKPVTGGHPIE